MRTIPVLLLLAIGNIAQSNEALLGQWGTAKQCARALITPHGTRHAAPFDIQADWLGHGDVWCRLIWQTTVHREDGLFAVAHGLCGEDAVRDYQIRFNLQGEILTIGWNLQFVNGPLMRCE